MGRQVGGLVGGLVGGGDRAVPVSPESSLLRRCTGLLVI